MGRERLAKVSVLAGVRVNSGDSGVDVLVTNSSRQKGCEPSNSGGCN